MKVKNFVKAFLLRCFILLCLSLFRNIWERLRDLGIIRDTDTFEAYVNADSEAEVAGTPTDDEIVAEIIEVETTLEASVKRQMTMTSFSQSPLPPKCMMLATLYALISNRMLAMMVLWWL